MKTHGYLGLAGLIVAGGCASPPAPPAPPPAAPLARYALQGTAPSQRLYPVHTSATSVGTYRGTDFTAQRATDDNTDLEWASADSDRDASLSLDLGEPAWIDRVELKAWPRSRFVIEVSGDGERWTAATGTLQSRSWQLENHVVGSAGRYLRIRFLWPPPFGVRHFSIFEVRPYGAGSIVLRPPDGGPYPPAGREGLVFMGTEEDRVGVGGVFVPNGGRDGHLRLTLALPRSTEITAFDLYELNRSSRARTGAHWSTRFPGNWILGVVTADQPDIRGHRPSLGMFPAGTHTFDLYAENHQRMFTGDGNIAQVVVTMPGAERTFEALMPG